MLVTEEEKCRKFEDGLNDYIQAHVTGFFHDDFSKIVTCALNVERVKRKMKEKKEDKVKKSMVSQICISNNIRDSEDHKVPFSLQHKDQPRLSIVRLFYWHY